jgi:Cu+-exporting ATPase
MDPENKVMDPVCGKRVDRMTPRKEWYNNTDYHFCSEDCHSKFKTNPCNYIPQTG